MEYPQLGFSIGSKWYARFPRKLGIEFTGHTVFSSANQRILCHFWALSLLGLFDLLHIVVNCSHIKELELFLKYALWS